MADINFSDGCTKSRSILGQITNLQTKRGFPEIENHGIKKSKLDEIEFVKQIRVTPSQFTDTDPSSKNLQKLSNENSNGELLGFGSAGHCLIGEIAAMESSKVCDGNKVTHISGFGRKDAMGDALNMDGYEVCSQDFNGPNSTDLEIGRASNSAATKNHGFKKLDFMKDNDVLTVAKILSEGKINVSSINPIMAVDALEFTNVEDSDKLGESCPVPADTSRTVSETSGDGFYDGNSFDAYESKAIRLDYQNEGDDHGADNFVLSYSGSVNCMILPESRESRVFWMERSTESNKGDECADGTDSIRACSCSFCSKAAHIWLDVNYQDIKARVSAMKKSQKEAIALAQRSLRRETFGKHVAKSLTGTVVSNLECDLMHQWRSLFQGVGDLLQEESNNLEARLQPLTDLRKKYKAGLKGTDAASAGKH